MRKNELKKRTILGVCFRSSTLCFLYMEGKELLFVKKHTVKLSDKERITSLIRSYHGAYTVDYLVINGLKTLKLDNFCMSKASIILYRKKNMLLKELFAKLTQSYPQIKKYVPINKMNGQILFSDKRKLLPLYTLAIVLAFAKKHFSA